MSNSLPLVAVIDASTSAMTVSVWDQHANLLECVRAPLQALTPSHNRAEQESQHWVEALRQAFSGVRNREAIGCLAITAQRETFVLLDENHNPLRPAILWYDTRATQQLSCLQKQWDRQAFQQTTGMHLDITTLPPKLLWLQEHEPQTWSGTRVVADVAGFLHWYLTGMLWTHPACVDTMGILRLEEGEYAEDILDRLGLGTTSLPELVHPEGFGELATQAALGLGLKRGIPVMVAPGDGHCQHLAAGIFSEPGRWSFALGTSGVLGMALDSPSISPFFRTLQSGVANHWIGESVIQCCSAAIDWFDSVCLVPEEGEDKAVQLAAWDEKTEEIGPGSGGVLVLPYLRGVRMPYNSPRSGGMIVGLQDHHSVFHLRRAFMESIAFEVKHLIRLIQQGCGIECKTLVLGGGGSRSQLWCRIFADVLNCTIIVPETHELTSRGAALSAQARLQNQSFVERQHKCPLQIRRRILPTPEHVATYEAMYELYRSLFEQNRQILEKLGSFWSGNSNFPEC